MRMRGVWLLAGWLLSGVVLAEGVVVEAPWIREPPPGSRAAGGFMVLRNQTADEQALIGATSPAFGVIELHRTIVQPGQRMMRMIAQPRIMVRPYGITQLQPGDYHLMLMQPKQSLQAGDSVPITLLFEDGSEQQITFPVQADQASAPNGGGMHHQHHHH